MPEVDRLNVKIEADASSLKKETKESVSALDRLKTAWDNLKSRLASPVKPKLDTSQYAAQIKYLENQIADLQTLIESDWGKADLGSSGVDRVKAKIEQLTNRMEDLKRKQNEVADGWKKSGPGLNGLLNKIKKIGLSILGIRTVFSLISRAVNTYLSQNDALREKLDGIYYALGSLFAPILEWIVNLFAKLLLYLNAFLKGLGLAGIQFKNIQKSTQKTQKTMRTLISGFDELNTLQKQSSEGQEGGITDPFANVKVNQEWIDKLTSLGEKLRPIFEWLWNTVKTIFEWVLDHIELVIAGFLAIKAIKLFSNLLEGIGGFKTIYDMIKLIGQGIITFIKSPIGGVLLMFAGWSAASIAFFEMWKNGWSLVNEIIKDVGIALMAIGAVILGAPASVAAMVAGIAAVLSTLIIVVHDHWDEIVKWTQELWANIQEIWKKIIDSAKEAWTRFSEGIVEIVQNLMSELGILWEDTKELCRNAWEGIKQLANQIWTKIKDDIVWIVTLTKDKLSSLWNNIKAVLSGTWENIRQVAINSWTSLKNGVISINQTIGNTVSSIWNGMTNTIKKVVNGIIGCINGMIRGLTSGINAVVGLLNKFSVTIPDWVPGFGGRHFGFNLRTVSAPQIPYLAKGGVIKEPTLAMLGEYANAGSNPEIAVPQNVLQDMLNANNSELVASFAQMTSQIISAINGVDMEVKIGDETIARSAARGNNNYKSMTGRSLITV